MSIIKRKAGSVDIVKSVLEFDAVPTEGSPNLVESGAVAQAIGNLGQPLQWKGPATVAQLNAGITGIQPGWTYTLTDAGTLTDGSIAVEVNDEVAWTEDGEWFKVGGENSKVALFQFTGTNYPDGDAVLAEQNKGKTVILAKYTSWYGGFWYDYYYLDRRVNGIVGTVSATYLEFYPVDNSRKYIKAFKDLDAAEPAWVWSLEDTNVTNMIRDVELDMLTNLPIAANTLRFSFSKKDYDPTVAGVASGGTWKKLITTETNVWDWNRSSNNWDNSFNDAFADQDNIVKVIATGSLSSILSANYLFQNCRSLVYFADTNLANATGIAYMFDSCSNLEKIPNLGTTKIDYCQRACAECVKVSSGSLALYNTLSSQGTAPSNKTNCFYNCGNNTTTGAAELAQIPVSWGGTMTEP